MGNKKALKDISVFIRNGVTVSQTKEGNGLPITRIETISDKTVNLEKCGYANLTEQCYPDYLLLKNDILISHINSEKHLAKCAIYLEDKKIIHGMNLLCLRTKEDIALAKYVFYAISSPYFLSLIPRITKKSVNQASFSISHFKELEIPVPQLATQHHIATTLDHATALIEKRKTQISELDNLIKAVFLEMFGDPTVNSKDWEIEKLVNVCNPKQWRTISTSELLPSGYTVYGANGIIGYFNEYTHQNPTLMITCRGATCGNVHISKPFSYINGNAMALDDLNNSKVNILFLFYLLKIRNFYDVISGSAQPQITKQGLDVVLIPLPPLDLQTLFAEKVCKIQAEKDRLQRSLVEMEQYLQSLMAKFFG